MTLQHLYQNGVNSGHLITNIKIRVEKIIRGKSNYKINDSILLNKTDKESVKKLFQK